MGRHKVNIKAVCGSIQFIMTSNRCEGIQGLGGWVVVMDEEGIMERTLGIKCCRRDTKEDCSRAPTVGGRARSSACGGRAPAPRSAGETIGSVAAGEGAPVQRERSRSGPRGRTLQGRTQIPGRRAGGLLRTMLVGNDGGRRRTRWEGRSAVLAPDPCTRRWTNRAPMSDLSWSLERERRVDFRCRRSVWRRSCRWRATTRADGRT